MKIFKKSRLLRRTLRAAAACALAAALCSDAVMFGLPRRAAAAARNAAGKSLRFASGIRFHMTFDEPRPVEWSSGAFVHARGAASVKGRFGRAREFSGRDDSYIETSATWDALGQDLTFAFWVKLDSSAQNQSLWFTSYAKQNVGFRLMADDEMRFYAPGAASSVFASYKFENHGAWTHLAATIDSQAKTAALYENGVLKSSVKFDSLAFPSHNIEFGKFRWNEPLEPFCGAVDEATIWRKAFAQKKIASLAKSRRPALPWNAPLTLAAAKTAAGIEAFSRSALRAVDNFNPFLASTRRIRALPSVNLHFSKNDARHFLREHENSLLAGEISAKGAKPRSIIAQVLGAPAAAAELSLDPAPARYPDAPRPSYLLAMDGRPPALARLRLIPPETIPDFRFTLPPAEGATNGFCRLTIDGKTCGVYYFETLDCLGLPPASAALPQSGRELFKTPRSWADIFYFDKNPPAPSTPLPKAEASARIADARRVLLGDFQHPWSWREWRRRERLLEARLPSPAPPRPAAAASSPLPSLHAYAASPLSKTARVPTTARLFPAGGAGAGTGAGEKTYVDFRGIRPLRTGIKYRGNTSFYNGHKKPISLEFDAPHKLFDGSDARHIALVTGYKDGTRLKNKLAYDLFRAFADAPGRLRFAPSVAWCEFHLNDAPLGVYEMISRIGPEAFAALPRPAPAIFAPCLFVPPENVIYTQEFPPIRERDLTTEIIQIQDIMNLAGREEFAEKIPRLIDLDNLADFTLLLAFTGNFDGSKSNYFFARFPEDGEKWFFIPWDYDATFFSRAISFPDNRLLTRCRSDIPGFSDALSARWRELRAGVLSIDALFARIDEMASKVAPAMEFERDLYPSLFKTNYAAENYAVLIAELKTNALHRLAICDERFNAGF